MTRARRARISGQWPGAVAVTNNGTIVHTQKPGGSSSKKAAQREASEPRTPMRNRSAGSGNRSHGGGRGKATEDNNENIPPLNKRRKVILSDDDDDDNDGEDHTTVPSSDTLRSSDLPAPKKKARENRAPAVPQQPAAAPQELDEDVPWLIRHAQYLNINDEDAERKQHGVYEFYDRSTNAYRTCGPFVNLEVAYFRGAQIRADEDFVPRVGGNQLDEDTYHWHVHSILSGWLTPELRDAEKEFGKYPDAAIKILQYIDAAGARGRSNDVGRLRDRILGYAGIETTKELNSLKPRGSRGWNNTTLARLLCPMNKLREFDTDPDAFCQKVLEDKDGYRFGAMRWPSFLYDEKTH
ncbi:hypothetical protein K466DRAFT_569344, partial [Polyporus arcularius HHB13444]